MVRCVIEVHPLHSLRTANACFASTIHPVFAAVARPV